MANTYSDKRILYVEDQVLIALDVQDHLADLGMSEVTVKNSLTDGLSALESQSYDLAILDIHLGHGETSFPLAEKAKERGMRIVFTTGYNSCELPERLAGTPVLEKPVSGPALAAVVQTIFAEALSE